MRGELSNCQAVPNNEWEEEALFAKVWDSVVFKMILGVTEHGITYKKIIACQISSTCWDVRDTISLWAHNEINISVVLPIFIITKGRVCSKLTTLLFIDIF